MAGKTNSLFIIASLMLLLCASTGNISAADDRVRQTAQNTFDYHQPILFADGFQSGQFTNWGFSEDDRYGISKPTPERIKIVDAPDLAGKKAVRFDVPRGTNSFRAEISLPFEKGFHERWYGERIYVPRDWAFDPNRGNDLVMQWHAIPGNWRATFPNLEISIGNTNWFIRQSYGAAQTGPTRTNLKLDCFVQRGAWVSWVVHARWSPGTNGLIQIWEDGKLVMDKSGTNVYSTIGEEYTPYFKTGIYHPEWHFTNPGVSESFNKEISAATNKVIYATEIKVGDERAGFEDVAPN